MRVFALQRFVNMARLIREICQQGKPPANEMTEPPAFTVSKQELLGKAIVFVTFSSHTLLGGSHQWGEKTKQSLRKEKEIEEQLPTCDCKETLVKTGSPG